MMPRACLALLLALGLCLPSSLGAEGSRVVLHPDGVLLIDGQKVFPIGFTMPPPPDGRTPQGKNGLEELRDAGATFLRTGVMGKSWDDDAIAAEQRWQDAAARYGLHCWVFLRELGSTAADGGRDEAMLRRVVTRFRSHPGLGVWKGVDEPEWGKRSVPPLVRAREIIRELDPNHPVAVTHAPRGTVESLRRYNVTADITGADIYPIGYPPGMHSLLTNKEISMVGDYTRRMVEVAEDDMPVWMILQVAWSGVIKPGKTLRFPTFHEERFMVYQAIINGARGIFFFGGHIPKAMSAEDAVLGWNWTYWDHVLRRVVLEIGTRSPLYPALLAPDSPLPVQANTQDVEFCVREVGREIFLLACQRGHPTRQVEFVGLPVIDTEADVLFEAPRKASVREGRLVDWFAPFEVHVYRMKITEVGPPL